ncbi:MAG: hypothetical protein OXC26_10895 [Albidovulum sp.]|nr:hypothetical protein [Albidovulum sp.]
MRLSWNNEVRYRAVTFAKDWKDAAYELLETAELPKKGRPSTAERRREAEPTFPKARRRHPAVESAISNLEQLGLDRVRTRVAVGF